MDSTTKQVSLLTSVNWQLERVAEFSGAILDEDRSTLQYYLTELDAEDLGGTDVISMAASRATELFYQLVIALDRSTTWEEIDRVPFYQQYKLAHQLWTKRAHPKPIFSEGFVIKQRLLQDPESYGISHLPIRLIGALILDEDLPALRTLGTPVVDGIMQAKLFGVHKRYSKPLQVDKIYTHLASSGHVSDRFIPSTRAKFVGDYLYSPLLPTQLLGDFRFSSWTLATKQLTRISHA